MFVLAGGRLGLGLVIKQLTLMYTTLIPGHSMTRNLTLRSSDITIINIRFGVRQTSETVSCPVLGLYIGLICGRCTDKRFRGVSVWYLTSYYSQRYSQGKKLLSYARSWKQSRMNVPRRNLGELKGVIAQCPSCNQSLTRVAALLYPSQRSTKWSYQKVRKW